MRMVSTAPKPGRTGNPWPALAVVYAGLAVNISDVFRVLAALPALQDEWQASPATGQLVVASYQLTLAVALVTGGRLGDRYGRRRVFCLGLALFAAASAAAALAPATPWIVAARIVQGFGSALVLPQVYSLLQVLFPAGARDRAFALMGAVMGMSAVFGMMLGGVLVSAGSWRWVLAVNVPLGLAILAAARRVLPESRLAGGARLDWAGMLVLSVALTLLAAPLIQGRQLGWPAWSWVCLALAGPALGAFWVLERRIRARGGAPLVDPTLLAQRSFAVGALLVTVWYLMVTPFHYVLSQVLQSGLGLTPLAAAAAFTPLALAFLASSLVSGRLRLRLGRRLLVGGTGATAVAWAALAGVALVAGDGLGLRALLAVMVALGLATGLVQTPLINNALERVREQHVGMASGVLSTGQQTGNALGVALVGVVFFAALGGAAPGDTAAWAGGLAAAAGFGLATVLVCLALLLYPEPAGGVDPQPAPESQSTVDRNRSSTRTPNSRPATGTRSSTPCTRG